MKANFNYSLTTTLAYEGGKSTDRRDPGNWTGGKVGKGVLKGTNMGIAANSYPNLDIMNLTRDEVGSIYKADYWDKLNGDRLASGVDLVTFDYGVNSGVGRAKKGLYAAVGGTSVDTVKRLCAGRLSFLRGLKTWGTYGGGWGKRVHNVEAKGIMLASRETGAYDDGRAALLAEAAMSTKKVEKQATAAAVTGSTSAPLAVAHGSMTWGVLIFVGVTVAVASGFLIWRSMVAKARADEFKAVANGL